MLKKTVFFDLDDTLYDYSLVHKKALKAVYSILKKHLDLSYDRFIKLFNLSRAEIHRELAGTASSHNRVLYFQRLIEKTHCTVKPSIILKLYDTYWNTLLQNIKLRKGALHVLKSLKKRGIKIAILSDLTTHIQLRKIKKLKIENYVDILVTSEEVGIEKPHPMMFLLALNKLNFLPQNALMVGDNPLRDIEGANSIGVETVLLKKGCISKKYVEDYRKPDYTIKQISELLKVLDQIEH